MLTNLPGHRIFGALVTPPPSIPDTTATTIPTTTTVIEEDIVPEEPDNSDMVEVSSPPPTPQQPPSSSPPVLSDSTITATTSSVPVSRFSFKPPVPTAVPIPSGFSPSSATSSSAKPLNLSSRLLPSLRPSSSSSSKPTVPSADNLPGDVQGRTSISKGGDVGFDIDYDLEYEVKVSKINKNKRKQFRPVTPMRDKKRRLRLQFIAQTIINSLAAKLQK